MSRLIIIILFLTFSLSSLSQRVNLSLLNKSKNDATQDQAEVDRLSNRLLDAFISRVNNPRTTLYKEVRDFISELASSKENTSMYTYPRKLGRHHISLMVVDFDNSWDLSPHNGDTSRFDGYRSASITVVLSIPAYDRYHRGYSINALTFKCTYSEVITYLESARNTIPIEKLPSYKREVSLQTHRLELSP